VLRKATGKPIDEFAREALFAPLGIKDVEWATHADMSPSASGGLRMRSRDLAKIDQLVLARGYWGTAQPYLRNGLMRALPRTLVRPTDCFLRISMVAGSVPVQRA
jgi:CubicO group peptidase (beta-lactamase class C family)